MSEFDNLRSMAEFAKSGSAAAARLNAACGRNPGFATLAATVDSLANAVSALADIVERSDADARRAVDTASMLANGIQPD